MPAQNTALKAVTLDHPSHKKMEIEIVKVTPELASEWLGVNHGNRNQRSMRIDLYERDMLNGNWLVTGETIKFDWNGRLIDGQHRLEAVVGSRVSITVIVVRGLDPNVQKVLDTNAKRSATDALGFHGVEHMRSIIATTAKIANARATGHLRYSRDTVEPLITNSEVLDWYQENQDVEHAAALASRVARKLKATPSVLSYIILEMTRKDPVAAITFIDDLENLRTSGEGDPRFTLLRALERQFNDRVRRSNAAQISLFYRAWNAARAGKRIRTLPLDGSNAGARGVEIPELI
ncbi:hypothetical protein [Plantibacter sp. YIM 135249]|uniref:hypothetical protein n=1 Tax=Plantibacter sp. YIM 135249 TaxID=3423918 RepID=UPI003D32F1F4